MSRTKLGLVLGLVLEMHKTINRPARRPLPKLWRLRDGGQRRGEKYEKFGPKLFNSCLVDSGHITLDGCSIYIQLYFAIVCGSTT